MQRLRAFNIVNLTLNLLILLLSLGSLIILFFDLGFSCFNYFTTWCALLGGSIAVIGVVYNCLKEIYKEYKIPKSISALKLLNVTNLLVCFFSTLVFIGPGYLFESYFYLIRVILTILSFINYILFDFWHKLSFKYTLFGVIPITLYMLIYLFLMVFDVLKPLYNFENIHANSWYITLLFFIIIILGAILLGWVSNLLNHLFRRLFIGEEYIASGKTTIIPKLVLEGEQEAINLSSNNENNNEDKTTDDENNNDKETNLTNTNQQEENKEEANEQLAKPISSYQKKFTSRVYHISRQKMVGKWQVKLAGSKKPIKYFDTQLEAINFAKGLVKNQGGSIRIHSLTGQMRKN